MSYDQIVDMIKNLGVPVVVLGYVLWRGDNFLRHLIRKLDKFNDELNRINLSVRDLVEQLKK